MNSKSTRTPCLALALTLLGAPGIALHAASPENTRAVNGATSACERWIALLEPADHGTGLLVIDQVTGTPYRLADFENSALVGAHWIGPNSLEVDFDDHVQLLEVRLAEDGRSTTFHRVTTEFNVQGAPRVDYFSPPLVTLSTVESLGAADDPETTRAN